MITSVQVVAPINRLLDTVPFTCTAYSLDWHPADHVSFIDNVHLRTLCPGSREPQLYGTVTFQAGQLSSALTEIFRGRDRPRCRKCCGPVTVSRTPGEQRCIKI